MTIDGLPITNADHPDWNSWEDHTALFTATQPEMNLQFTYYRPTLGASVQISNVRIDPFGY